jgi:pathogenesis-related protein 1
MAPIRHSLIAAAVAFISLSGVIATSQSDIDTYLSTHNTFRAQHGANNLIWSANAANTAQNWANGCKFQHSGGSYGGM